MEVNQGQASVYWHDESNIRWHCEGRNQPQKLENDRLRLQHAQCIVFLPKQGTSINIDQGQVVIVRPQASVTVEAKQSELRIAENDNQYRYEIHDNDSYVASFESHNNAKHTITIKAQESTIKHYEYR